METMTRISENWLTRKPVKTAFLVTSFLTTFLLISGLLFISNYFHTAEWMPGIAGKVFESHEYWRPWTALFAHADLGHLMNNTLLFLPLTYLLSSYYSLFLFPFLGLFLGGIINFFVLKSLPIDASLIGISGVVYWMGAVWLTLFVLIDTRKSLRRRVALAIFLTVVLFAPQTYEAGISYLSHLLGYAFGILSGLIYYGINRRKFKAAEVKEFIFDDLEFFKSEPNDAQLRGPEIPIVQ
jgi:rhomboid protease GluP